MGEIKQCLWVEKKELVEREIEDPLVDQVS